MANLCDYIEQYLKTLLKEGESVELQRVELADHFGCAPSQINYVLSTRFSPQRGYMVESRRGGGGYIRLTRLRVDGRQALHRLVKERVGEHISQDEALGLTQWLQEEQIISKREAQLMGAALIREALGVDLPLRDFIRARLLRSMLVAILRFEEA